MARRKTSQRRESPSTDARFDASTSDSAQKTRRRRESAKLCSQIRRTLQLTFIGEFDDEVLHNLTVEEVEPAPSDRRLRVKLVVADRLVERLERADVEERIEAVRPFLLGEVAQAIHRRRCPELVFELERR